MTGLFTNTIAESTSGSGITFSNDIVPATPLSHRNMIINGAMQIWQRGTSEVTISNGSNEGYTTVDRFKQDFGNSCAGAVKWSRATEVPDLSGSDMFTYSLKVQTSTANSSPDTSKLATIDYRVEAHDMQRFGWGKTNKKNAVLSFYLKTSKTGVYSWYFQSPGTGTARHRMISFSVSDTNWKRYSIPLSADTVAITDANTEGLQIRLNLIRSPSNEYSSGTDSGWGTTIYYNDDDQVNFLDNTSNILYLTGMQFEIGNLATPFEHRSFSDELARCQRYYQNSYRQNAESPTKYPYEQPQDQDGKYNTSWSDGNCTGPTFTVAMRTQPTVILKSFGSNSTGKCTSNGSEVTCSATSFNHQHVSHLSVGSSTSGAYVHAAWEANAEL
jgi:hypothetical protein